MALKSISLLVAILAVFVDSKSVKFHDCLKGTPHVTLTEVDITPCGDEEICKVYDGQKSSINVTFKSLTKGDNLTASIFAIISQVKVNFPDPYPDACNNCGLKCPLVAGQTYSFNTTLEIPAFAPSMIVEVGFLLEQPHHIQYLCAEVAVEVVSKEITGPRNIHDFLTKNRIHGKKPEMF